MGTSYVVLLTAFYVDNGPHLPLVEHLPGIAVWVLPALVGLPPAGPRHQPGRGRAPCSPSALRGRASSSSPYDLDMIGRMVIEERIHIAASVMRVWDLIANPERMPDLSPELRRIQWVGTATPQVGGTFQGHNGIGPVRWRTRNVIEVVEPGRTFGWRTMDGPWYGFVSRWTYRLQPLDRGCEVTERFETASWLAVVITRGLLWGRGRMLRGGMRATLRTVKAVAEAADVS